MELHREPFLSQYGFSAKEFEQTGLDWDHLQQIYNDHAERFKDLDSIRKKVERILRFEVAPENWTGG